MTNKDILEQYAAVKIECKVLEKELSELRGRGWGYVTDAVSGCSDELPYSVRSVQIAGMAQDPDIKRQIEQLETKLKQQYGNAMAWRNRAEAILSSVGSAKARVILRHRYVDGLEWDEIADKLDDGSTMESVRKFSERTLKNL